MCEKIRKYSAAGRFLTVSAALLPVMALVLSACSGGRGEKNSADNSQISEQQTEEEQTEAEQQTEEEQTEQQTEAEQTDTVESGGVLYIGTRDSGFDVYPITCEGSMTPEILIAEIAELTGWDLTLAGEVTVGKGGMSICFADSSSLFTGPPEPQKEDFFMFDAEELAHTILDSIQKTLQQGFVGEGGDPDALDIYYYMEGDSPLKLPNIDREWPIDQPYMW